MAVVNRYKDGWILDEVLFYGKIYKDRNYNGNLYKIDEPFRMQSQVDAIKRGQSEKQKLKRSKSKILQKRTNCDEIMTQKCKTAEEKFMEFVSICRTAKMFLDEEKSLDSLDNNKIARETLEKIESDIYPNINVGSTFRTVLLENSCQIDELFSNIFYLNQTNATIKVQIRSSNSSYMIPKFSRFINGDVKLGVYFLIEQRSKFDLIIIDPPWENKSVKRKRNYEILPENHLCELKIDQILNENGLLALWMTNNRRLRTFVQETLIDKWKIKILAEWIWLKTTTRGEPVCEFRPDFKMPFESLLICTTKDNTSLTIKPQKYFMSVPCVLPSRKVPVMEILNEFLPENHSTLELFARNLLPNATSVGLEVLKMQNEKCFEICQ